MNPALVQHRLDKQKALKKGKAEALTRRNEKLARRNPDRIQRQINDLKSLEESGQPLRPRDKQILEALERDFRAVQKAREALGEKAPKFPSHQDRDCPGRRGDETTDRTSLGKRRRTRDEHDHDRRRRAPTGSDYSSDGSDTDESVRRIPMPSDTPPPVPREYQRKFDRERQQHMAEEQGEGPSGPHPLPAKPPVVETRTVYEAAPAVRNLRQEAVNKFVPAAVRLKQESIKGQGKLLEPEELDRLEQSGYLPAQTAASEGAAPTASGGPTREQSGQLAENSVDRENRILEEERRFNQELRSVQIEEMEDDGA